MWTLLLFEILTTPGLFIQGHAHVHTGQTEENLYLCRPRACISHSPQTVAEWLCGMQIAICMAYMMLAKEDPVAVAAQIYAGYVEHVKLTEVSANTRLCMHLAAVSPHTPAP